MTFFLFIHVFIFLIYLCHIFIQIFLFDLLLFIMIFFLFSRFLDGRIRSQNFPFFVFFKLFRYPNFVTRKRNKKKKKNGPTSHILLKFVFFVVQFPFTEANLIPTSFVATSPLKMENFRIIDDEVTKTWWCYFPTNAEFLFCIVTSGSVATSPTKSRKISAS